MFAMHIGGDEFEDPEIVLLETVGAAQAPDWETEQKMVAAIEQEFLNLKYLTDDLIAEGGMNKHFAMEAHRLIPGMADKYPLGYFTEQTTATLYRPALEELHAGVWALIGAAGVAIAAMIWKFVRWIIRKWKGESGSSSFSSSDSGRPSDQEIDSGIKEATQAAEGKVHQTEEVAKELRETTHATKEAVRAVEQSGVMKVVEHKVSEEGGATVGSFEDAAFLLTERHMKGKFDPLINLSRHAWFDILHNGRWSKLMLSLGPILSSIEQQLVQRVQVFESIFSVTQTQGDPIRHKNALDLIEKAKETIKLPGTNYHSLEQLARSLDRPEGMMAFNAGKEKLNPIRASEELESLFNSSSYKSLLQSRVHFVEKLAMFHKAQVKLSEISNKWNASHPGQGVGVGVPKDVSHAMAPAITQLKRDLTYMMQINTAIEQFLDEVDSLNNTLATWWSNIWTAIQHYADHGKKDKDAPPVEMPAEVQKAQGMLQMLRRAMGKVPASDLGGGFASKVKDLAHKAISAGAAPKAGQIEHPKDAVAPAGARQIPKDQWQGRKGRPR